MNGWLDALLGGDYGARALTPEGIAFLMLLAFAIGQVVAFVYIWTHQGLSYSRTFVASMVVLPLLVAIMMTVVAGSVLVALGLLAIPGLIRFRNVLKDTRDTTFILWAVMEGLAIGTMRYSTAVVAAAGVAVVLLYLRVTSFGTRHRYDAVLSLRLTGDPAAAMSNLREILRRYTSRSELATPRRASDAGADLTYRVLLRDSSRSDELQALLAQTAGLENVALFLREDETEI